MHSANDTQQPNTSYDDIILQVARLSPLFRAPPLVLRLPGTHGVHTTGSYRQRVYYNRSSLALTFGPAL